VQAIRFIAENFEDGNLRKFIDTGFWDMANGLTNKKNDP